MVYINLRVAELIIDTLSPVSVCAGESYTPVGIDTVLSESGLYQFDGINNEGKATLTLLDFRIESEIITYLTRTACAGSPFNYEGELLSETGIYDYNYTSVKGCDSLVIVDLTVGEVMTTTITRTITPEEGIIIGKNVVNLAGNYEFIFQSEMGCDSIVLLTLTLDGEPDTLIIDDEGIAAEICTGSLNRKLCLKDLPFEIGPNTFWQGGNFDLTYTAPDGCIDNFQLALIIEENINSVETTICEGSSYLLNNIAYTQTGIYTDTLFSVTANNCDSIIVLDLEVMPTKDTTFTKSICWGEPFMVNGEFITASGTYTQQFITTRGCDSSVTTILTIEGGPNPETAQMQLCAGESYADDLGNKVFVSGLYNFMFVNSVGCDSMITLDLLIPDTIRSSVDTFFCQGEAFTFENFAVTKGGRYRERFTSALGCDSIVQYTLTALDCEINSVQDADTIICGGNTGEFSFMLIKGQAPFRYQWTSEDSLWSGEGVNLNLQEEVVEEGLPGGLYIVTVTDRNGQEAILEIEIFRPEIITAEWITPDLIGNNHLACQGDTTAFLQINPSGGLPPYRYAWSNGETTNRIENLSAGNYTLTITDDFNCPFTTSQQLSAPPPLNLAATIENPVCEDLMAGIISVSAMEGGTSPYEFRLDGINQFSDEMNFKNLSAGDYILQAIDANGCQIDTNLLIIAPEILVLDYESDVLINLGESYDLNIGSSGTAQTIIWEDTTYLSCEDCLDVVANPVQTTTYTLTVTSMDNCATTIQINVVVSNERYIFAPNVFSPNSDGLNDGFTIFGNPNVANVDVLQIYSRWGELVYETNDLVLNEELKGWDGHHRGQKMNPSVFVWLVRITFIDGETVVYSGDLTLVE
ncbi:MAG: gliding motility-associated C-terminal domain-containing protein, partial [Saprospiraceae bacterium]